MIGKNDFSLRGLAGLALCLLLLCPAWAQPPLKIHYQGRALDPAGAPLITSQTMYFSIWSGGTATEAGTGTKLYSESATVPPDSNGVFEYMVGSGSVTFGSLSPAQFNATQPIHLQVAIGAEANVMLPRAVFTSVGYAFVADNAVGNITPKSVGIQGYGQVIDSTGRWTGRPVASAPVGASRGGLAILYPDGKIQRRDGSIMSVAGSPTAGLQELFNYCSQNNSDGYVIGGTETTGGAVVYNISQPVTLRPSQGFRLDTGAVTLNFNYSLGANTGLTIDSCMMVDFRIRGQIVYQGTGTALAFSPTGSLPIDTWVGNVIVDSSFHITTIAASAGAVEAVMFRNPVVHSDFFFNEINGGVLGIHVNSTNFSHNRITCKHVHGQSDTNIKVENGRSNVWEVSALTDVPGVNPVGISTAGVNDFWIASVSGNPGIILQPTAASNQFHLLGLGGGFVNNATSSTNRFYTTPDVITANTPSVPASGTPIKNRNPCPVIIHFLSAGSVSNWAFTDNGSASFTTPGPVSPGQTIYLSPGESITLNYSSAPTWRWRAVP